jgi:hypothetical protein
MGSHDRHSCHNEVSIAVVWSEHVVIIDKDQELTATLLDSAQARGGESKFAFAKVSSARVPRVISELRQRLPGCVIK